MQRRATTHAFRRTLSSVLSRAPLLYARLLRARGRSAVEKLAFLALVEKGDNVWDIGANVGNYTLLFSDIVGKRGRVHAFEPVARTFTRLEILMAHASNSNYALHQVACTDRPGNVTLYLPDEDSGQASLRSSHQAGSWSKVQTVHEHMARGVCIDDLLADTLAQGVDFIKCDVEGAELLALRGAKKAISMFQPLLFLELCGSWTTTFGYSPADLTEYLQELGYREFALCGNGTARFVTATKAAAECNTEQGLNLIAAVSPKHTPRLNRLKRLLEAEL